MNVDIAALRAIERDKDIPFETCSMPSRPRCSPPTSTPRATSRTRGSRSTARPAPSGCCAHEPGDDGEPVREWDDTPEGFGRIAATTARQVIVQRLRDAEHERTYGDFSGQEGEIVAGVVQRDVRATPAAWCWSPGRRHRGHAAAGRAGAGRALRARRAPAVLRGRRDPRRPRPADHPLAHPPRLVRKLFALEVPEIADGSVEITAVAREAGHRTKIAVRSDRAGLNAKGACIGPMGARVRGGDERADRREDRHHRLVATIRPRSSATRSRRPRCSSVTVLDARPARPGWSCPTSSCRWPSARRARTPGSRRGSPAGASTSATTPTRASPGRPPAHAEAGSPVHTGAAGDAVGTGGAAGARPGLDEPPVRSLLTGHAYLIRSDAGAESRPSSRRPGPISDRQGPVRTCVGCRTRAPAGDLLRVVAVDGVLTPDPRRRLPGVVHGCTSPGVPHPRRAAVGVPAGVARPGSARRRSGHRGPSGRSALHDGPGRAETGTIRARAGSGSPRARPHHESKV